MYLVGLHIYYSNKSVLVSLYPRTVSKLRNMRVATHPDSIYLVHRKALVSPKLWDQSTKLNGITHQTISGLQTYNSSSILRYIGNTTFNVNLINDDTFGSKPQERI